MEDNVYQLHTKAEQMREIGQAELAKEPVETWQSTVLAMLDEAEAEGINWLTLGQATVHVIRSSSDPNDFYYELVFETDAGRFTVCAKCKSFRYRNKCDHTGRVP